MAVLPTASESPLVYACELWAFAICPALRGSTVSYAGDAHFAKHSLEYSLNFWSQPKKKTFPSLRLDWVMVNLGIESGKVITKVAHRACTGHVQGKRSPFATRPAGLHWTGPALLL